MTDSAFSLDSLIDKAIVRMTPRLTVLPEVDPEPDLAKRATGLIEAWMWTDRALANQVAAALHPSPDEAHLLLDVVRKRVAQAPASVSKPPRRKLLV